MIRNRRPSKMEQALEIRTQSLAILSLTGAKPPLLQACRGDLHLLHHTPFCGVPYSAGLNGLPKISLPYGLNISVPGVAKVFNLEWDFDGRVDIVTFKRGSWEEDLATWALKLN